MTRADGDNPRDNPGGDRDPDPDRDRDRDARAPEIEKGAASDVEEAAASDIERARAASFGDLLDRVLAGGDSPPAIAADERALLDVAQMVRAGARGVDLGGARARAVVDDALRATAASGAGGGAHPPADAGAEPSPGRALIAGGRRASRSSLLRALPWTVAGLAAAAAIALALTRSSGVRPAPPPRLAARYLSRPADRLVGVIPKARAGLASERLDTIFADRMAGYRALRLGRLGGGEP